MANPYGIEGRTLAYWGGSWIGGTMTLSSLPFASWPVTKQLSFAAHSCLSQPPKQRSTSINYRSPMDLWVKTSHFPVPVSRPWGRAHWSVRPLNVSMVGYWNPQVSKKPPVILTAHCFLFWILKQLQPGFFVWEESSLWPLREKHCPECFITWGSLWSCLFYRAVSSMYLIRMQ